MIRIKKLLILASVLLFSCSLMAQNGYEIKVKAKNFNADVLYLGHYYGTAKLKNDSAFVGRGGTYVFKGEEKMPAGMYFLYTATGLLLTDLILGENQVFSLDIDTAKQVGSIVAKASVENELFFKNRDRRALLIEEGNRLYERMSADGVSETETVDLRVRLSNIQDSLEAVNNAFITENPEHLLAKVLLMSKSVPIPDAPEEVADSLKQLWQYEYYKAHYFDNVDFTDNRVVYTPVFDDGKRFDYFFDKVIAQAPDSIIKEACWLIDQTMSAPDVFRYVLSTIINKYGASEVMGMDAVWVALADRYYLGGKVDWVSDAFIENFTTRVNRLKPILIGSRPPELIFVDTNVNTDKEKYYSLYGSKTDYTVVIFWEPSCGHCKKELPKLKEFYLKNKDSLSVEVYAVTIEPDIERWKEFLHQNDLPFIHLYGYKANRADWKDVYDVSSTPVVYVFDKDKKIIAKRISAEQLEGYLNWWKSTHP